MRRLFRSKRLLWAVLVLSGVAAIMSTSVSAQTSGQEDRPVDWRDVPTRVSNAYWEYAGITSPPNPAKGVFMLRAYVASELRWDGDLMDVNADRRLVGAVGWDSSFIEEFDRAIAWGKAVSEMGHAQIREIGKKFEREILEQDGYLEPFENEDRRLLDLALFARDLQDLAIQRGSYAALLDQFERYLESRNRPLRSQGVGGLEMLANDGYAPAQRALSERLIEGRGFDVNLRHALYWARLAQIAGEDTTDLQETVEKQVSSSDKQLVEKWVGRYQPTQNLDRLFKVPTRRGAKSSGPP